MNTDDHFPEHLPNEALFEEIFLTFLDESETKSCEHHEACGCHEAKKE